ncbi:MAG: hypothetical protein FRX49_10767 [Trebouxia sp. A1-2]|nr:MAG: hypothetical protein FRX49_10767 [Trebouxia sp. A1-2]
MPPYNLNVSLSATDSKVTKSLVKTAVRSRDESRACHNALWSHDQAWPLRLGDPWASLGPTTDPCSASGEALPEAICKQKSDMYKLSWVTYYTSPGLLVLGLPASPCPLRSYQAVLLWQSSGHQLDSLQLMAATGAGYWPAAPQRGTEP